MKKRWMMDSSWFVCCEDDEKNDCKRRSLKDHLGFFQTIENPTYKRLLDITQYLKVNTKCLSWIITNIRTESITGEIVILQLNSGIVLKMILFASNDFKNETFLSGFQTLVILNLFLVSKSLCITARISF